MRLASWNVNSLKVRLPHLLDWLELQRPDVVCLQETKLEDSNFPFDALQSAGYHVACAGQKTYNGVAILSREPLTDVVRGIPGWYEVEWPDVQEAKGRWEPWADERLVLDAVDDAAANLRLALDYVAERRSAV